MRYIFGKSTFDEFCMATQLALLLLDRLAEVAMSLDGLVLLVDSGAGAQVRDLAFNASEYRCVSDLVPLQKRAEVAGLAETEVQ